MQVKSALRIQEPADSKGGNDTAHAEQRCTDPVTADPAHALFGRHRLGPVV